MKKYLIALAAVCGMFALAACDWDGTEANAKSDETVCVFDGSEHGSQKLKKQIFPGEEPYNSDSDDIEVHIPLSNRFYSNNYATRTNDPGAPETYTGYTNGQNRVAVNVQGQYRFKFLADRACEWYDKHGRRNDQGDGLGFNARGGDAIYAPWLIWLNENFGNVSTAVIKGESDPFTWVELVYGKDPEAPRRSEPSDIAYGKHIGRIFTDRLNRSLGGQFFCGDPAQWSEEDNVDASCPPIFFELGNATTVDPSLTKNKAELDKLRSQLESASEEAKIRANREQSAKNSFELEKAGLQRDIELARLRALADSEVQKCLALAEKGLDCEGKYPTKIVGR